MARLLVADDNLDVLGLIVTTLELEGHDVATAQDGAEAVRAALTGHFEVIVLDVLMPKVDGLSALRQLRNDPLTSGVPVLLLSTMALSVDIEAGMRAGASGYLTKPFDLYRLVAQVAHLTERASTTS